MTAADKPEQQLAKRKGGDMNVIPIHAEYIHGHAAALALVAASLSLEAPELDHPAMDHATPF